MTLLADSEIPPSYRSAHGAVQLPYTALTRLLTDAQHGELLRRQLAVHRPPLTDRQRTVLDLMAEGHGNAAIARTLSCSEHTVKNTVYELMSRLHARNRAHAVAYGLRHGLI